MKKVLWVIFIVSVPVFIIGFVPLFPWFFGLCEDKFDFTCLRQFRNGYIFYLAYLTILSPLAFFSCSVLLLRLKSNEVFQVWKKFTKYYLPIAATLIILSSGRSGGGWGVSINFDTELTTWFLVGIFFAVSVGIIAYQSWKRR